MARMDRHKRKMKFWGFLRRGNIQIRNSDEEKIYKRHELVISILALIVSFLGLGYNFTKDFVLNKENVKILIDNVYTDEVVELKESEQFYVPGKGFIKATLMPVNGRIVLTNKSSKPVSIKSIHIRRNSEHIEVLNGSEETDTFLNYISIDGEIKKSIRGDLIKPIFFEPNESKMLVINFNHGIPDDVLEIIKSDTVLATAEYDGNEMKLIPTDTTDTDDKLNNEKIHTGSLNMHLANKSYSIWGKMKERKFITNDKEIPIFNSYSEQLPNINVTCITSNDKKFNAKGHFKDFSQ